MTDVCDHSRNKSQDYRSAITNVIHSCIILQHLYIVLILERVFLHKIQIYSCITRNTIVLGQLKNPYWYEILENTKYN